MNSDTPCRLYFRPLLLAAVLCLTLFVSSTCPADPSSDREQRLDEIGKQMEKAASEGKPPPPGLLEELQKITQEMLDEDQQDDEEDESQKSGEWTQVPFTGMITITKRLHGTATMKQDEGGAGKWSMSSSGHLRATITHSVEIKDDEGNLLGYQPVGRVSGQVSEKEKLTGKGFSSVSTYSASDQQEHSYDPEDIDGWCTLYVNPKEKKYEVSFPSIHLGNGTGSTTATVRSEDFQKTVNEPFHGIDPQVSWYGPGPDKEKLTYSPSSGMISGSHTFHTTDISKIIRSWPADDPMRAQVAEAIQDIDAVHKAARGKAPGYAEGTYTVTWHLSIGKPKAEVVLETVDDYDKWMPQMPMGAGNTLKIKARIKEPAGMTGRFEFKLEDVSKEPGICMNCPADDADTTHDLSIAPVGPGLVFGGDGQSAKTDTNMNEVMIIVQVRDWGAFGKLSAKAKLLIGGEEVEIPATFEKTGEPYVTIPKDQNSNSIADAWEEHTGVYPCAGDADDDDTPEGRCSGDGLSAYEEYRGFYVQGFHKRLNPKKKDLFVYDPEELIQKSNFAAASQLEVHYPTDKESNCDSGGDKVKVVNFNSDRYHIVDQHCLWVKTDRLTGSQPFNWGACEGTDLGPPRTADKYVLVFADQIREDMRYAFLNNKPEISNSLAQRGIKADDAWLESQIQEAIKMVAAHEACHGLDVSHHYKSLRHALPKTDDVEEAILSGDISPSFGQMSCFMRYIWDGSKHPRIVINAEKELMELFCGRPWPNTLCGSGSFDDCRTQILVSDAEGGQFD